MRLLLDTQIFLWFLARDRRLRGSAREAVISQDNAVHVSAASIWEIAIKTTVGRLKISDADIARLPHLIDASGFDELPVVARHAAEVHLLPMHHRDPFDRLLVAQARTEGLALVTVDSAIRAYDVPIV
jgi:PIN domain nuclease of toxin-antitoxin system